MSKPKFHTILSLLIFALIIVVAINYHNNNVLESRINTLGKSSSQSKNTEIQKFKEDYYITQQGKDTDLLLFVFGLSVTIMGVLTYQNIVTKFEDKIAEVKNEFEIYKNDWEDTILELEDIKMESYMDNFQIFYQLSKNYLQESDYSNYAYHSILAVSKFANSIRLSNYRLNTEEEKKENCKFIIPILKRIDKNLTSVQVSESQYNLIENELNNLRRLENNEVQKVISSIHMKIKLKSNKKIES